MLFVLIFFNVFNIFLIYRLKKRALIHGNYGEHINSIHGMSENKNLYYKSLNEI